MSLLHEHVEGTVVKDTRTCVVCQVPFTESDEQYCLGDYATVLMNPTTGAVIGWAHKMCAVSHHDALHEKLRDVMCAVCNRKMMGNHGFTQGRAWGEDGHTFVRLIKTSNEVEGAS